MTTCKNCGMSIDENAKFCGFCGATNLVETPVEPVPVAPAPETPVEPVPVAPAPETPVEPVPVAPAVEKPVEPVPVAPAVETPVEPVPVAPKVETPVEAVPVIPTENKSNKKNGAKTLAVVLIVLVALGTIGYLVFNYLKNNNVFSSGSVDNLVKAVSNIKNKSENSATMTATVDVKSDDAQSNISMSLIMKYVKNDNDYKFQVKLAKSLFLPEMDVFATVNNEKANIYLSTKIFDALESEQSSDEEWVKYEVKLNEIFGEDFKLEDMMKSDETIDYSKYLNKDTVKYVGTENGLAQYKLIINQKLVDMINELPSSALDATDLDSEKLTLDDLKDISIDFYVDSNKVLSKIKISYGGEMFADQGIKSADVTITFSDLNSTIVTIPEAALNTTLDFDTYMEENMSNEASGLDYSGYYNGFEF